VSNFLAVATVTAVLQKLLEQDVVGDVPGATVTTDRPDTKKAQTAPAINVFLYHVEPSPALRDADLPTRRPDGTLAQRARAAVDLHYLLTFYGNDAEFEPQRLLGATVRTFHARPIITRDLIAAVVAAAGANTPRHASLVDTDLGDADDVVRLCPHALDLEALSKLWSVFFQVPYVLSMAWSASVVLLEESTTPVTARPVVIPAVSVAPLLRPRITSITMADDPSEPIVAGTVRITGTELLGDTTAVRVGGLDLTPEASPATSAVLEVALASSLLSLRAGRVAFQVIQARLLGPLAEARGEIVSDPVVVDLHPTLTSVSNGAGQVTVTTDVPIRAGQQVALQFFTPATGESLAVIEATGLTPDTTSVTVTATGVPNGPYGISVLVDGVASPLTRDPNGAITAPTVTIS